MKFDVDLETGTVRAEFSLAEAQEILDALAAARGSAPREVTAPAVWKLAQESWRTKGKFYQTRIWFDSDGRIQGACQCPDSVYRKHWCKHLILSDAARQRSLPSWGATYASNC